MGEDKHESAQVHKFKRPGQSGNAGQVADWSNADASKIQKAISAAGIKHGAMRFGYSRDGGAYAIGVYAGNDYFTDYVRPNEDIDAYLDRITEAFEEYDPAQDNQVSSGARKRAK